MSFDDKKKNYKTWAKKFLSAATLRGYNIVLTKKDTKVPKQDLAVKDTEADKRKLKLRKTNQRAYCELMLTCKGTISFAIVEKLVTDDLPTGDAYLAWKKLKQKFNPQTSANKLKLKKQFTNSSLTDWKKDPDDCITGLDILRTQLEEMGHTISDEDFKIHILNNLPTEYKSKVESLEKDLDNKDCPVTLDQMTNKLNLKYEKICKKNEHDPESGEQKKKGKNNANDTALAMRGFKGFRGRCHFCGNFGHKQSECPSTSTNENQETNNNNRNQNNQKETTPNATNKNSNDYVPPRKHRFNGKCDHCRKWGYR